MTEILEEKKVSHFDFMRVLCENGKLKCQLSNRVAFDRCGVHLACLRENETLFLSYNKRLKIREGLCICDFLPVVRDNPDRDIYIFRIPKLNIYTAYIVPVLGEKRFVRLPPDTWSYASLDLLDNLLELDCEVECDGGDKW